MHCHARSLLLLAALSAHLGCYKAGQAAPTIQTRTGAEGQPAISPPELVSLTETLADTYAVTVAQVVNQIQQNAAIDVRTRAQRIKAFVGTTAYSIAAGPNPEISMIDLVVNISVQRHIFSSGMAARWFGERGSVLLDAYADIDQAGWATLKRVYTDRQIAILRDAIARWLAANPSTTELPFVRLPGLGKYRDLSPVATPGSVRILAPIAGAEKTAQQLRLLGERSLYIAQRYPYLVNWTSEATLLDVAASPESQGLLRSATVFASSADRLAGILEQLPEMTAMQRTLTELNATLVQVAPLLGSMRGVIGDLNQTLGATDRILAPFESRAVGGGPPERTFDVGKYGAALRELADAAREMNGVMINGSRLVQSPELGDRLNQLQGVTDSGLGHVADQGNRWIDRIFWRALALVLAFFASLFVYRVATIWMTGKVRPQR